MLRFSLVQKNKARGNLNYSIRIFDTVTKVISFVSTNTKNRKLATEIMNQEQREKLLNGDGSKCKVTLYGALSLWLDHLENDYPNKNSVSTYKSEINGLLNYSKENRNLPLLDFKGAELLKVFGECTQTITPNQKRQRRVIWGLFFNWAFETYDIGEKNPVKIIKLQKKEKKEKFFWTPDQVKTIIENTTDQKLKLLFSFMAFAGLRFFEANNMTWDQIEGETLKVTGKGNKFSVLPLGRSLREQIEQYRNTTGTSETTGRIFPNYDNWETNKKLKKIVTGAGVECAGAITCHRFRHSFASNLLRAGANIVSVSKLLRHENPSITLAIYSHVLPNDLDQTLNLL